MKGLTKRQLTVLLFIEDFIIVNKYPPTFREIGKYFGIKSTKGVSDHLDCIERKGYITRKEGKARTIVLTTKHRQSAGETDD